MAFTVCPCPSQSVFLPCPICPSPCVFLHDDTSTENPMGKLPVPSLRSAISAPASTWMCEPGESGSQCWKAQSRSRSRLPESNTEPMPAKHWLTIRNESWRNPPLRTWTLRRPGWRVGWYSVPARYHELNFRTGDADLARWPISGVFASSELVLPVWKQSCPWT